MRCSAISCQLGLMKMISETSLEKMPSPSLFRFGLAEDGPVPIYTSKSKYAALILSLGNLSRGRKRTGPSAYSGLIDYDSTGESRGALVKSIAQSKSHLFMLCEAAGISKDELDFIYSRGWQTIQSISGDILIGSRTNLVGSSLKRLAGSTLVGVAHSHLPLTYMIVEIIYRKTVPAASQANRGEFPDSSLNRTLERAGSDRIGICMFHLKNTVAATKVALAHECLGTMLADCLHYQVDLIGGDPNMALSGAMGHKQESMDIRGGMYQSLLDYYLDAWSESPACPHLCYPKVQHVSANSLCLLKQYGDQLGGKPYRDCVQPARPEYFSRAWPLFWSAGTVCLTTNEFPSGQSEYKISVSEWLLNSTRSSYLFG